MPPAALDRRAERICNALAEEFGPSPTRFAPQAEDLLEVLDYFQLPEDDLLFWIREKKHLATMVDWRIRCEKLAHLRLHLGMAPPTIPQMIDQKICSRCHSSVANRVGKRWFCAACGCEI